jgi:hypothetical protein
MQYVLWPWTLSVIHRSEDSSVIITKCTLTLNLINHAQLFNYYKMYSDLEPYLSCTGQRTALILYLLWPWTLFMVLWPWTLLMVLWPWPLFVMHRSEDNLTAGGRGGMRSRSPQLSVSESTPTHTDYTEGTPSFTASSPSCCSDVLGTALYHTRPTSP